MLFEASVSFFRLRINFRLTTEKVLTMLKDALFGYLIGSEERTLERETGWTKSPSREFFFDVCELITKANDEYRLRAPNAQIEEVFTVTKLKTVIADRFKTIAVLEHSTAIVWKTTKTKQIRNLGEAALVEILSHFVGPDHADPAGQAQQSRFHGFHYTQEEYRQIHERVGKDNFGMYVTALEGSNTGLSSILLRIFLHCVEVHLRKNKGSFKKFKAKSVFEKRFGDNLLSWEVFFDTPTEANTFLDTHVKKKFKGAENEKRKWIVGDEKLVDSKIIPFTRFFTTQKQQRWNEMLQQPDEAWQGLRDGFVPNETGQDPCEIVPMYDTGEHAIAQEHQCMVRNWNEALTIFYTHGTMTLAFMNFLISARREWQECKRKYILTNELDAIHARLRISRFVPRTFSETPRIFIDDDLYLRKIFQIRN